MGTRYLITGVQIGMLQAFFDTDQRNEWSKLLKDIVLNQYVGMSNKSVEENANEIVIKEEKE